MARPVMIEGLESRTLMSATPAPMLFNPVVRADRAVIRADLARFRADIFANGQRLMNDTRAIKKNIAPGDTSLTAPLQTLHTDVQTMRVALLEDRLTEAANALRDESVIKLDILQIIRDRKNATAEVTDHQKLRADRVTLQNDLVAGLDSRIATRQANEATIAADAAAIVTAASTDAMATPALQAAVSKFATDRVAALNALTGDLQAIAAARAKLASDLTSAQST